MNPYIYFENETEQVRASIGANDSGDGEVILSFTCYPHSSTMCVPMSAAVELATKILCIANKQLKEAA